MAPQIPRPRMEGLESQLHFSFNINDEVGRNYGGGANDQIDRIYVADLASQTEECQGGYRS